MGIAQRVQLALSILLHAVYISSPTLGTYQVSLGAGIGMMHASSVMDTSFYIRVERRLFRSPAMRGIVFYRRFADDVVVVARGPAEARCFKETFISLTQG